MITQDRIQYGETTINYNIVYSDRRKNVTLVVYPLKQVEISVPSNLQQDYIRNLVKQKAHWILNQLLFFEEIMQLEAAKEYVNGETFLYLGRQYRLSIQNGMQATAKLRGKYLTVGVPSDTPRNRRQELVKGAVWRWYRRQAKQKIKELVTEYSLKLRIEHPRYIIKNQYKRWGSCSNSGVLYFNLRTAMAPMSQMRYVVAHELCHLKEKDHSKKFWQKLRTIMPDYEATKERLRKEGWQYQL